MWWSSWITYSLFCLTTFPRQNRTFESHWVVMTMWSWKVKTSRLLEWMGLLFHQNFFLEPCRGFSYLAQYSYAQETVYVVQVGSRICFFFLCRFLSKTESLANIKLRWQHEVKRWKRPGYLNERVCKDTETFSLNLVEGLCIWCSMAMFKKLCVVIKLDYIYVVLLNHVFSAK